MKSLELTTQLTDQICQELMNGQPLTKICSRKELPSLATINRWITKHPSFAKQITNARRVGTQFISEVKDSSKKTRLIPFEFSFLTIFSDFMIEC